MSVVEFPVSGVDAADWTTVPAVICLMGYDDVSVCSVLSEVVGGMSGEGVVESCEASGTACVSGAFELDHVTNPLTVCGSDHHIGIAHEIKSDDHL